MTFFLSKYTHTLQIIFILGLSPIQNCLARKAPILILNRATQCYFNAGLQCIFATQAFEPWIKELSVKCLPTDEKDKNEMVKALKNLTITYNNPSTTWADNAKLFKVIQIIDPSITETQQGDVIEMMGIILAKLPEDKACDNPFIMKTTETMQGVKQVFKSKMPVWQTLVALEDKTNLIDVLQKTFSEATKRRGEFKIKKFPIILCCGITATVQAESLTFLQSISIPYEFFLHESIITESPVPTADKSHLYKLVGIAWRTTPKPGSATGHYFATVQYRESWEKTGTWYVLDEAWAYVNAATNQLYSIDKLPPIDALKIHDQSKYLWMHQFFTPKILRQALAQGFISIQEGPTKARALPTFVVYERQSDEYETKTKRSALLPQAASESLQSLQQDLTTLSALIK
jgi:hypothetical protein